MSKVRFQANAKLTSDMTPMIDVVFQLMIFFLLTLKITAPEGDFTINMPLGPINPNTEEPVLPEIKIRLIAAPDGKLAEMRFGQRSLGNDPNVVYDQLNSEILKSIGRPGNPLTKNIEVEIDADFELHMEHTTQAMSACMGRFDSNTGRIVRYIENVKFAAPRQPKS